MNFSKLERNGILCAFVNSENTVITDAQSALDLLMSAKYEVGTKNIILSKKLVTEDFFLLSTGLAGEILQKYINYGGRIAIYIQISGIHNGTCVYGHFFAENLYSGEKNCKMVGRCIAQAAYSLVQRLRRDNNLSIL